MYLAYLYKFELISYVNKDVSYENINNRNIYLLSLHFKSRNT